jgi:hypothetical protein
MWGSSKKDAAEATPLAGPHASSPVDTGAGLPWAGQIVAGLAISVDVLFNNIELRFSGNYRFALFIGVLGTLVGTVGFLMQKNRQGKFDQKLFSHHSVGDVTYGMFLAGMMLVLWSVAVGVLTFWSPYLGVGNGYLATWLGAVSSAYALGVKQRSVFDQAKEQTLAAGPVLWLLLSSVTVLLALLPRAFQYIPWARALGFSTSAVSFVITLFVLLIDRRTLKIELSELNRSGVFLWLAVLWTLTGLVLTYRGPFNTGVTANGYFGSWMALFSAIRCSSQTVGPVTEAAQNKTMCKASKPQDCMRWWGGAVVFVGALALCVMTPIALAQLKWGFWGRT